MIRWGVYLAMVASAALAADIPRTPSGKPDFSGFWNIPYTPNLARDTPEDKIENLVSGPNGRYLLRTPKLETAANGAGDALAALFFAHYLRLGSAADALSKAVSSVFGVLERTAEAGASEMLLVDAQEEFVKPTRQFIAEKLK